MRPAKKAKLDGLQAEYSRLLEGTEKELRRKDEALKEAMKILCGSFMNQPSSWKDMPEVLRNDPTALVQAIVGEGRFPLHLKREDIDEQVLQEALPILLADYREAAVRACEDKLLKWEEVNPTAEEWRGSVVLSLKAMRRGLVQTLAEVPKLADEHNLIINASVKLGQLQWDQIPAELQSNLTFCREVLDPAIPHRKVDDEYGFPYRHLGLEVYQRSGVFEPGKLGVLVFRQHPELVEDHDVWKKLIESDEAGFSLLDMFRENIMPVHAPLIEQACRIGKKLGLLRYINQVEFSGFVKKMINEDIHCLFHVTRHFIVQFPEFFTAKLAHARPAAQEGNYYHLVEEIPPDFWNDENFAQTWLKEAGLPFCNEHHPDAWSTDRHKLLLVAEHGARLDFKTSAFARAPEDLRGDLDFIEQAMQYEPYLFRYASEAVRNGNPKLAIWAMGDAHFLRDCMEGIRSQRAIAQRRAQGDQGLLWGPPVILAETKLQEMRELAASRLHLHKRFVNPFLCAIFYESNLLLGELNGTMIAKLIGDFAGVPRGGSLRKIKQCLRTVQAMAAENQAAAGGNDDE